jgi:hypothetical protein
MKIQAVTTPGKRHNGMSSIGIIAALVAVMCLVCAPAAEAQSKREQKPKPIKPVTPPKEAAVLPAVEKPAEPPSPFPALPASRPCEAKDLRGLLQLAAVYEDPAGAETANFQASPYQYMLFRKNNLFSRVNLDADNILPKMIAEKAVKNSSGLMQFLLQDNGFMYLYQNSVAVEVHACFIVDEEKTPFKAGQMLLMPPKGQIQGRLAKVYNRIGAKAQQRGGKGKGKDKNN